MKPFAILTSRLLPAVLPALIAVGCASVGTPQQRVERTSLLETDLRRLGPDVDSADAARLAVAAIEQAAELNRRFRPARPAWFNNILVNARLRERGLCYHWTNEMFKHLQALDPRSLRLHLAVAHRATAKEHNTIVVTARGQPFEEGIVLDAWRDGGRLWWSKVSDDRRHPWKPLPPNLTPKELQALVAP